MASRSQSKKPPPLAAATTGITATTATAAIVVTAALAAIAVIAATAATAAIAVIATTESRTDYCVDSKDDWRSLGWLTRAPVYRLRNAFGNNYFGVDRILIVKGYARREGNNPELCSDGVITNLLRLPELPYDA